MHYHVTEGGTANQEQEVTKEAHTLTPVRPALELEEMGHAAYDTAIVRNQAGLELDGLTTEAAAPTNLAGARLTVYFCVTHSCHNHVFNFLTHSYI